MSQATPQKKRGSLEKRGRLPLLNREPHGEREKRGMSLSLGLPEQRLNVTRPVQGADDFNPVVHGLVKDEVAMSYGETAKARGQLLPLAPQFGGLGQQLKFGLHRVEQLESRFPVVFGDIAGDFSGRVVGITDGDTITVLHNGRGEKIRLELVKVGYAWWYRKYAPHNTELERLEEEAREAKRGLWTDQHAMPPWEYRKIRRSETEFSLSH